ELTYILSLVLFKIVKYKFSQIIQRRKESLTVIGLSKFSYKALQPRICRNHKSSNRDPYFSTPGGQVQRPVQNFVIQAKGVLIISISHLQAGRLSVRNHKNLLIRILSAP